MAPVSDVNLLVYMNMQEKSNALLSAWVEYCIKSGTALPLAVAMGVKGANDAAMDFLKTAAGLE